MRAVAGALSSVLLSAGLLVLAGPEFGSAAGREGGKGEDQPKVITDGRLRPGHLEALRVKGFPGAGVTEVAFFPTAICEDACSGRASHGGRTDPNGGGRLRVRVPQTFLDQRHHPVYFRDGERVEVLVTWEGRGQEFAVATADPEPILVRRHQPDHG